MAKEEKGYTVLDTVDAIKQRDLPNSDPAHANNMTYQNQEWDHTSGHTDKVKK